MKKGSGVLPSSPLSVGASTGAGAALLHLLSCAAPVTGAPPLKGFPKAELAERRAGISEQHCEHFAYPSCPSCCCWGRLGPGSESAPGPALPCERSAVPPTPPLLCPEPAVPLKPGVEDVPIWLAPGVAEDADSCGTEEPEEEALPAGRLVVPALGVELKELPVAGAPAERHEEELGGAGPELPGAACGWLGAGAWYLGGSRRLLSSCRVAK